MQDYIPPVILLALTAWALYAVLGVSSKEPQRHVFLDLEPYSTRADAAILAIGAVCMDSHSNELSRIKLLINIKDTVNNGHVDPQTVEWWEKQSKEAQRLTFDDGQRFTLEVALGRFYEWYKMQGQTYGVWGNGATFDCGILRSAYDRLGMPCPWDFWEERDVRTVVALGKLAKLPDLKRDIPFDGIPHNCVDDAAHQGRYTIELIRALV